MAICIFDYLNMEWMDSFFYCKINALFYNM